MEKGRIIEFEISYTLSGPDDNFQKASLLSTNKDDAEVPSTNKDDDAKVLLSMIRHGVRDHSTFDYLKQNNHRYLVPYYCQDENGLLVGRVMPYILSSTPAKSWRHKIINKVPKRQCSTAWTIVNPFFMEFFRKLRMTILDFYEQGSAIGDMQHVLVAIDQKYHVKECYAIRAFKISACVDDAALFWLEVKDFLKAAKCWCFPETHNICSLPETHNLCSFISSFIFDEKLSSGFSPGRGFNGLNFETFKGRITQPFFWRALEEIDFLCQFGHCIVANCFNRTELSYAIETKTGLKSWFSSQDPRMLSLLPNPKRTYQDTHDVVLFCRDALIHADDSKGGDARGRENILVELKAIFGKDLITCLWDSLNYYFGRMKKFYGMQPAEGKKLEKILLAKYFLGHHG